MHLPDVDCVSSDSLSSVPHSPCEAILLYLTGLYLTHDVIVGCVIQRGSNANNGRGGSYYSDV